LTARLRGGRRSSGSATQAAQLSRATHLVAAAERVERLLHALLAADAPGRCLKDLLHTCMPGGVEHMA